MILNTKGRTHAFVLRFIVAPLLSFAIVFVTPPVVLASCLFNAARAFIKTMGSEMGHVVAFYRFMAQLIFKGEI